MTAPRRPAPVLRYLRRPLWWALGAGGFIAVAMAAHVPGVLADAATFEHATTMEVAASEPSPSTDLIDVTYTDPATGRDVQAAMVEHDDVHRMPDGRVQVEVSTSDPTAVRPVGDTRSYLDDWAFYLVLGAVPLVAWAFRIRHVHRLERLMASSQTTFAMLAAVAAPEGIHRRWRLCLYPLNAEPGAPPVCAVELIWLPVCPSGAFAVDVKGEPRPFGLVAVRAGDDGFWPRGRALATRATVPRPAAIVDVPDRVMAATGAPRAERAPLRTSLALRVLGLAALAVFAWVYTSIDWQVEQVLERSRPATATVQGETVDGVGITTAIAYDHDGVTEHTDLALDDQPPTGTAVPIRYDAAEPASAWPADDLGPVVETAGFLLTVTLPIALGLLIVGAFARQEELTRLGRRELAATGRVELGAFPRGAS